MAFWLRAGLVIGAIYYLSPLRLGDAAAPEKAKTAHLPASLGEVAGAAFERLPGDLRARIVETATAEAGRSLEAGLRNAVEAGRPTSRDTLTTQDRQPSWRGAAERESR
ncbi:hypothetical protein NS228_01525 [Methylobacterium indicum]|uniref:hypothetical protein n=1 Tax=Methylobacterium indicum TaxID=1775910 RepID=UPI0007342693|nr:hypothetical protein [Methylobacterium indicum]KTS38652.1 hypothetical protein NS229_03025 [Methylobacterium indicum]KTS42701.1 hypothetical protein NS228_01525 [Methylobacterium indicum]KTS52353.1 hypothetical protein NS230_10210 [Methylobacterium indicum]